ncbi:MAG: ABC transporter ATP-binding protein [Anaerolineae bacterium]|nr:ABC transporter ATP-binding protein [Anaerolineae bacterium]
MQPRPDPNAAEVIDIQNLTHRYGKVVAVEDVSFSVKRGEIFGFLGPNGAGKTTTIRTILDLIRPTQGQVLVFGLDSRRGAQEIHRRIGYLPSELRLWDNWTGAQYIRWLETVHQRPILPEAEHISERLQFELGRSLSGMSTGMKRKMGLIAAISHQPELLILDEPSIGLDPLMQQVFNELMREARAAGRTVFLSSHNLAEVEQICDRVAIIREGKLEAVEAVHNLTRVTFRWITLTLPEPAHADGFRDLEGIEAIETAGEQLRLRVSGRTNIDALIKQAAQHTVQDISIEHPTLEEIFLAYYGQKEH